MAKCNHLFLNRALVYEFQTKALYVVVFLMIHIHSAIPASSITKLFQFFLVRKFSVQPAAGRIPTGSCTTANIFPAAIPKSTELPRTTARIW